MEPYTAEKKQLELNTLLEETSDSQYDELLQFVIENNIQFAPTSNANNLKVLWWQFTKLMNLKKGPKRSAYQWEKIWQMWSHQVRVKYSQSALDINKATELTDVEKRLVNYYTRTVLNKIGSKNADTSDPKNSFKDTSISNDSMFVNKGKSTVENA